MIQITADAPLILLVIGVIIVAMLLIKELLGRVNIPPLVGWIALGLLCRVLGERWGFLTPETRNILGFLAELGLVTLLFKIGLESKLARLVEQLGKATYVWVFNVLVSGLVGYIGARYLLGMDLVHSLVIGIALTATSVGVSVKPWEESGAIERPGGQLLVDIAELDDISSIILMGFLFAVIPVLTGDEASRSFTRVLGGTAVMFVVKMALFSAMCVVFVRFLEKPVTRFINNLEHGPDPMLTVMAIGFIIASIAALHGFSIALGAFFAGLAFSRDPEAVKMEASFESIYELFSPFFFLGIGLDIAPVALFTAVKLGSVLLVLAVLGKFIGTALPVWMEMGFKGAVLLGVSMIPRAEITMVIMDRARTLSGGEVSEDIFSAMVLVSAATCVLAPVLVKSLLKKGTAP